MAILHIYGARDTFHLFCDNQDTQSESCEIEMSISQPIFTHKKISKYIWYKDIHTMQDGRKNVAVIHIYGARDIYLLFCDHQDTESESQEIEMSISQQISTHKKYI